ncbi:MAG: hypothetical protein KatS3mg104_2954 [Phycisphaerae bacterium]|nr:MAG: hypothetical protein KatS3mg104_2954 [Phycisphaerae bacterium]
MAASGRIGVAYVWNGAQWVDIGTVRNLTITTEGQTTERDAHGRAATLTQILTAEATLLQNTETEFEEALSHTGTVSVFFADSQSASVPSSETANDGQGMLLNDCSVSTEATLDLGGGESFITLRFMTKKLVDDAIDTYS